MHATQRGDLTVEFHQVRYFLKAAEHLNFTRAAEQCHVSQPALTRAIQKLEAELGGELFVRDGRSVKLSALGNVMREHCGRIQETQQMARTAAKSFLDQGASELNVGVMCTIGPDVLSAFLNDFQSRHSDVLIILHDIGPEALPELLLTGALDSAFIAVHGDQALNNVSAQPLFEEDMVVTFADGHRFASKHEVTLFDIAEEPYVDRLKCEIRQPFFDFMQENDLDLRVVCSSQREDWIQELVIRGLGVSVMPRFSITTRRLGWRNLSGPLFKSRRIMLASSRDEATHSSVRSFNVDAADFEWQAALETLDHNATPH